MEGTTWTCGTWLRNEQSFSGAGFGGEVWTEEPIFAVG